MIGTLMDQMDCTLGSRKELVSLPRPWYLRFVRRRIYLCLQYGRALIVEKLKRYDSVKEVAENSDVVVTAVGKPHQIREVHIAFIASLHSRIEIPIPIPFPVPFLSSAVGMGIITRYCKQNNIRRIAYKTLLVTTYKRSWGKAMFLHMSVSHSVHRGRGVYPSMHLPSVPLSNASKLHPALIYHSETSCIYCNIHHVPFKVSITCSYHVSIS